MSEIEDMEKVVEQVSDWAVDIILQVKKALGDRPFGLLDQSPEEEMMNYEKLRGNPQAWFQYIDGKAQDMVAQLTAQRIPPEKIATIRPYEIVIRYVMDWSKKMEDRFSQEMSNG